MLWRKAIWLQKSMNSATKERSNSNSNYHNIKYTILVVPASGWENKK